MNQKKYIVTNFAYGTGPYLRTTQLALAFNDELEKKGKERLGIIVPLAYGEKQRQIMLEEFGEENARLPGEILVDVELGRILSKVLFTGKEPYESYLSRWTNIARDVSAEAKKYLSGKLSLVTLQGEKIFVEGKDIALELNRSPRMRYDVAPSFFTSFAYLDQILEGVSEAPLGDVLVERNIIEPARKVARWVEDNQMAYCIPYPATFSYSKSYKKRYSEEVTTAPLGPLFRLVREKVEKGIYITVTGIPGLERLYAEAHKLGIALYSNDPVAVPGSARILPHIIADENILFHFARSGWSSVWLSMLTSVPLIVPQYDPHDDPEIYFNNRAVEALGVGVVWRNESLKDLLKKGAEIRARQKAIREEVERRFGSWDGIHASAKIFVEKYLAL